MVTAPGARIRARSHPSSWCFRISTGLTYKLLTLTQQYNVSWDMSLIDYAHRTPNVLCVKGHRAQTHLFGPDVPSCTDPLDFAEWFDLCNDDEALAEDCDFAQAFSELPVGSEADAADPGPAPAPPAGPPFPGPILPPRPPPLPPTPPDSIRVQGSNIFLAGEQRPIGRQSAMVHWWPPSVSMRCLVHDRCRRVVQQWSSILDRSHGLCLRQPRCLCFPIYYRFLLRACGFNLTQ